jgi:5-methylthioadenosine/S-adenosylhomocysteine deaminase
MISSVFGVIEFGVLVLLGMPKTTLIKNGTVVTMNARGDVFRGDVLFEGRNIAALGADLGARADEVVDAGGCAVLPGFVQTHVHLCQTLMRGMADDLSLLDWLKRRVWPLEAAHSKSSVRASARLGIAELIKGGTTCALTMETVRHTDEAFAAVQESGFRATVGKCMMDKGDEVPDALMEDGGASVEESVRLMKAWHGRERGRIRYCFAPRFAVSCTKELLLEVAHHARENGVAVHTHASENRGEIEIVQRETGQRNVTYLHSIGLSGRRVVLAHCVHLIEEEISCLARTGTHVAHCPSSNLKLGSGLAKIHELLERGVSVTLGADGAPCNNRLDMFTEMRTAALLQKALKGPEALPAQRVLRMATLDGARALGIEREAGSLEIGKRADIIIIALQQLHATPRPVDVVSTLVYSSQASDVRDSFIEGRQVMRGRELLTMNETQVIADAQREAAALNERAGGA